MKKEVKTTLTLLLIIGLILIPFKNVEAHSVELDPDSLIRFSMFVTNGEGTITIDSSETGYSLYYQALEIPDTVYGQIEEITNNGQAELDSIEEEINALKTECDNLETVYDEAYEAYNAKVESGETDEELETLRTAFETAQTNYRNKVNEYNSKVDEYNNKVAEVTASINELTPTYVESDWIETQDGSFSVDISQFSGDKAYVIWARLVTSDGTNVYDEQIYTMSGSRVDGDENQGSENTNIPNGNTNTPNGSINISSGNTSYTGTRNDSTTSTNKLPYAGTSFVIIAGILGLTAISIVCYKKYNNYKDIK